MPLILKGHPPLPFFVSLQENPLPSFYPLSIITEENIQETFFQQLAPEQNGVWGSNSNKNIQVWRSIASLSCVGGWVVHTASVAKATIQATDQSKTISASGPGHPLLNSVVLQTQGCVPEKNVLQLLEYRKKQNWK